MANIATSPMVAAAVIYQAGAIALPETLVNQATMNCAEPPNTETASA